jgi:hypothetical protein
MAAYWESDGVDDKLAVNGSYASVPCNLTSFEVDIMVLAHEDWHQIINFGARTLNYSSSTQNIVVHADFDYVQVNGVNVTAGTAFIPLGTRVMLRGVLKAGITTGNTGTYVLSNSTSQFLRGRIYGVKMYQGATLALQYDPALGHMNDTSGNARNAIMTGGTYGDDAATSYTVTGAASGSSTATGAARKRVSVTGTAAGSSTASGGARRRQKVTGAASGASSASGRAIRTVPVSGAASGSSSAQSNIAEDGPITYTVTGSASSSSTATGAARRRAQATGAASGSSSAQGTAVKVIRITGAASSSVTVRMNTAAPVVKRILLRGSLAKPFRWEGSA